MHKRLIACVLAAVMLVMAFAACTSSPPPSATPTAPPATGGQTPPPPAERDVITITALADGWAPDMEWDIENDKYAQIILERFQVLIDPKIAEGGDTLKLMAAAGTLPDVFVASFAWDRPMYNSFIDDQIVRKIPFSMIDKFSRVKELVDLNGLYIKSIAKIKGVDDGVFSIPKPVAYVEGDTSHFYATGWHGIYYRADWAQALGISKPKTLDEYYNMIKKFTTDDPNGNGLADEYGLSSPGQWALTGIVMPSVFKTAAGGAEWYFDQTTQKWNLSAFDPNMGEMLEWYQGLDDEGILDPEFPLLAWNTVMQKFASETIGAFGRNMDTWWLYNTMFNQIGSALKWTAEEAVTKIGAIATLKRDANDTPRTYATADIMGGSGTMVRRDVSDEVLERYLEVHNWILSEESKLMTHFGFEEEHWKWNDDKTKLLAFTNPDTGARYNIGTQVSKAASFGGSFSSWTMDVNAGFAFPAPPPESYRQLSLELRQEWQQYVVPAPSNPAAGLIYLPEQAMLALDVNADYTLIIQGDTPAREAFNAWVQKMMNNGADDIIDKFNQKANELGIDPAKQGL